ncbi:MAG: crossover junction endodeoxyribonuclease RuvC [Phycisphaerae bacterium]|nr:crossover junction endodeoxyribonuclease RuvC [Phycisphaerae bacterium]
MRILGIDPGTRITGYGCVNVEAGRVEPQLLEAGVLRFDASRELDDRLVEMHDAVAELIESVRPDRVAVEKLYAHYKHPRTAILMAHARGVMLLAARRAGLPVDHLPATEVKKSMTGNGHASKQQVQEAVATVCQLPEPPSPPDVADAIAIAYCSARRAIHPPLVT